MRKNAGSTDVTVYFKLIDPTTGAPETGLTVTSLTLSYVRDGAARVGSAASALAAVTSAHTDYGMIEVDSTNCPGLYRADFPDAAFASGVDAVQLVVNGAAIDPAYIEVEINFIDVNISQISGDSTAADNLESDYDGTGYTKTNSTVGTVTDITNAVTPDNAADTTAILADTNELQTNQGNWLTATGFAEPGDSMVASNMRGTDDALLAADAPTNFSDLAITTPAGEVTAENMRGTDGAVTSLAGVGTEAKQNTIIAATDTLEAGQITINNNVLANGTAVNNLRNFDPESDELENGKSYAEMQRIMYAAVANDSTNNGTTFASDDGLKTRLAGAVDGSNNRTISTKDGTL